MADEHISIVNWTPTVLAGAAAVNDVIAATEVLSGALRRNGRAYLTDIIIETADPPATSANLNIYLLDSDVAVGTEDSAPSITAANAKKILALIQTGAAYVDMGAVRILHLTEKDFGRIGLRSLEEDGDLYAAIVTQTAVTFAASDIFIRFKFLHI